MNGCPEKVITPMCGMEIDTVDHVIRLDLTKPQVISVIGYDERLNPKQYFLKITGRGIVLV